METESRINLKRFAPKKASKVFLFKIAFYIIILTAMGVILFKQMNKVQKTQPPSNIEINKVEIDQN